MRPRNVGSISSHAGIAFRTRALTMWISLAAKWLGKEEPDGQSSSSKPLKTHEPREHELIRLLDQGYNLAHSHGTACRVGKGDYFPDNGKRYEDGRLVRDERRGRPIVQGGAPLGQRHKMGPRGSHPERRAFKAASPPRAKFASRRWAAFAAIRSPSCDSSYGRVPGMVERVASALRLARKDPLCCWAQQQRIQSCATSPGRASHLPVLDKPSTHLPRRDARLACAYEVAADIPGRPNRGFRPQAHHRAGVPLDADCGRALLEARVPRPPPSSTRSRFGVGAAALLAAPPIQKKIPRLQSAHLRRRCNMRSSIQAGAGEGVCYLSARRLRAHRCFR